ncbi:O-antigen ligase family protein [Clostridium sp.]|uniref:O-antigen ligase family protein n=1 Tax=Clostridium sp. TaxID=1506 RepID=UPI0034646DF0
MSFSRMGLFTVTLYFIFKFVNIKMLKMNTKLIYMFNFIMILISLVVIIFFKSQVLEFTNEIIYKTTKLLGRESTLRYSFDLVNDSRVISSRIALESVKNNIFIGNGLSYWKSLYYMPPHNTFVSIIQDTGIIGFVLFSLMNIYPLKKIPLHILMTLLLLPMVTLDLQNYRLLFMLIGLMTTVKNDNLNIRGSS